MDYQYQIYPDEGLIVERFSGAITISDVMDSFRSLYSEPDYHPAYHALADFRDATLRLGFSDVFQLTQFLEAASKGAKKKLAILPGKPVNLGAARMYQQVAEDLHIGVGLFEDEGEALDWLKIPRSALKSDGL